MQTLIGVALMHLLGARYVVSDEHDMTGAYPFSKRLGACAIPAGYKHWRTHVLMLTPDCTIDISKSCQGTCHTADISVINSPLQVDKRDFAVMLYRACLEQEIIIIFDPDVSVQTSKAMC